jgi:hypothetical protein
MQRQDDFVARADEILDKLISWDGDNDIFEVMFPGPRIMIESSGMLPPPPQKQHTILALTFRWGQGKTRLVLMLYDYVSCKF